MRSLRLLDKSGQLVRVLGDGEAETLIAAGKAEFRKTGRRETVVLLSGLRVTDFRRDSSEGIAGPALRSLHQETHAGRSIPMLRRVSEPQPLENGFETGEPTQFHKWDNELTFDELRAGQLISQATRERKLSAEWRTKHIISFLAWEEYERAVVLQEALDMQEQEAA